MKERKEKIKEGRKKHKTTDSYDGKIQKRVDAVLLYCVQHACIN